MPGNPENGKMHTNNVNRDTIVCRPWLRANKVYLFIWQFYLFLLANFRSGFNCKLKVTACRSDRGKCE